MYTLLRSLICCDPIISHIMGDVYSDFTHFEQFGTLHKTRDIAMDIMLQRILELLGSKHGAAQEMVRALELPKNIVTEWKAGRKSSYRKYAPQIADYFGVSLDWLSGLTDERTKKTPSEDEVEDERIIKLRAKLSDMSGEQLDKLIAMMDLMGI